MPRPASSRSSRARSTTATAASTSITLNDVQGLRDSAERAKTEVVLWDSGSGTGSIFFFNYDYVDDDLRKLIREPKFRQAISHAFNREAVQKSVYFNTGEPTTGTLSPKAIEYTVNDTGQAGLRQLARLLRRVRPGEGQGAAGRARRQGHRRRRPARAAQRQEAVAAHRHPGRRVGGAQDQGQPADLRPEGGRDRDDEQPDPSAGVRRPVEVRQADEPQQLGGRRRPEPPGLPAVARPAGVHPLGAAAGSVVPAAGHGHQLQAAGPRPVGAQPAADGARARTARSRSCGTSTTPARSSRTR